MSIILRLTETQILEAKPEIAKMLKAASKNKPGMLIAQISSEGLVNMGFVAETKALAIQKIMGNYGVKINKLFEKIT